MTTMIDQPAPPSATTLARPDRSEAGAASQRSRRRRLLAWSALPALALSAVGVKLVFTSLATDAGIDAYRAGAEDADRFGEAIEWFDRAAWINVYERAIPAFDRGDAHVAAGELALGRAAFEEALELTGGERRCKVVVNLALTMEMQGDAVAATDEPAAQDFYAQAKAFIEDGGAGCLAATTAQEDGSGDRLQRALARLDEKIVEEEVARVPRASADEAGPRPEDPSSDDVEELERRMEENAERRSQGEEINESLDRALPPRDGPSW